MPKTHTNLYDYHVMVRSAFFGQNYKDEILTELRQSCFLILGTLKERYSQINLLKEEKTKYDPWSFFFFLTWEISHFIKALSGSNDNFELN